MAAEEGSIPVSDGKEYHYNILYNYDSGHPDDIERSRLIAERIADTLSSIGFRSSYFDDRDCLPGKNVFQELFRVVEKSEYTIVVLTPGFVLGSWSRYTQQASFKELLDGGRSHRFLPLCFGLDQANIRVPIELDTQVTLEFSTDWENDEESWIKLKRVFTEERSEAASDVYSNQRISDSVEETNPQRGHQAENLGSQTTTCEYNPITYQYEVDVTGDQPSEGGSSTEGQRHIIYSRISTHDSDRQGQGQGDVTGREGTDERLQETSLVLDGDHQDEGQDDLTWRATDERLEESSLVHDDLWRSFATRVCFSIAENLFAVDSLSRIPGGHNGL
ncbi:X-linked interleukin-1 receptor accessory protein-like 2 [Haliotis cracherodii]|uniref:X-linked interleukin-1 receptor accessory protein-like 2 n=1 Tax=Haliotis cracherodii TaxID=6455 RepID=UPI0039EAA143